MKKYLAIVFITICAVSIIYSCSSSSPSDPGGGGGPPDGYVAYSSMSGFFGNGFFTIRKEGWDTYITGSQTFFDWDDDSVDLYFCIQLPVGYNSTVPLPHTWNIRQGGYCHDGRSGTVSIEASRSSPPGYDAFLGVSGQFTLTEYDPHNERFKGSFQFIIGAFYLENGFEYGGDHYYDTTFSNGSFDYSFSGVAVQSRK